MTLFPTYDAESALYIWAVYGLALVVIGGMILGTFLRARAAQTALARAQHTSEQLETGETE